MTDKSSPSPLSMRQNVLWNSAGSLVYQGAQWLITILVVIFSADYTNSGILAYAMTVGNIFSPIATFNVRTFQVSDVNNQFSQQNYVAFRFVTTAGALVFCMIYAIAVAQSIMLVATIGLYLLFKADESFAIVLYGVDQRAYRMDYIGISQAMRGILILAVFSGSLVLFESLNLAIVGMFLLCLGVTVFYDIPHAKRCDRIIPSINLAQIRALTVMCFPAVLSTLFCGMIVAVTRQYFGNVYGSEALGIYAAIATPSVIIQLLAQYLYSPALGPIAERWTNESGDLVRYLAKLLGAMIVAIVFCIAALSVAGDYLLTLVFGPSIAPHTYLFPYVLLGTGLIALVWFGSDALIVFRKTTQALTANAVGLAVAFGIMMPLIEAFGMNGINFTIIAANGIALIMDVLFITRAIAKRNMGESLTRSS